ncbi:MAG: NFACT RNA binding domain-containing protein [Ignavibacteriota bacterium]
MYKSYYYLNRLTIELNSILVGRNIINIFSQEKDRLIIELDGNEELFLEVSVNHSEPFINIRNRFSRAKKNTIGFFNSLLNKTIKQVLIASDDRIIKIVTNGGDLFFAIRGKYTNLFFKSETLTSFKNETEENLINIAQEFDNKFYHNSFSIIDSDLIEDLSIEEIRKKYQFIGREIEYEVKVRRSDNESDSEILLKVLQDIFTESSAVYLDEQNAEVQIGFDSFKIFSKMEKHLFDSVTDAFNNFLIKKYQYEEKNKKLKKINLFLDRELKKNASRLNNLIIVVEKGSQDEHYSKIANLLLINLNTIPNGVSEIEIDDIYNQGDKILIKLDCKLSAKRNANRYFEKARDSKINYEKSSKLYSITKNEYEKLKSNQQQLENNPSIEDINIIMKELKIKDEEKPNLAEELSSKFKHYLIENKYHVYVGKDSANNDLLTTKFAKQNDFWFHARSVSGSHVVLRVENTKEAIPKNILKKTASLAAYHSKAKTAGFVPVSYTLKKYVSKRKATPIGQVSLLKEDVLLVKPEIPTETEYLTE